MHILGINAAQVVDKNSKIGPGDRDLPDGDEMPRRIGSVDEYNSFQDAARGWKVSAAKSGDLHPTIACLLQVLDHGLRFERPKSPPEKRQGADSSHGEKYDEVPSAVSSLNGPLVPGKCRGGRSDWSHGALKRISVTQLPKTFRRSRLT
jgi:hypothetical protein